MKLQTNEEDLLPGAKLVKKGLLDLANQDYTEEALLVLVASPALRDIGFIVPNPPEIQSPREHLLFSLIEERVSNPHSYYNSLLRLITSYVRTKRLQSPPLP